jgi:hypothetical protein
MGVQTSSVSSNQGLNESVKLPTDTQHSNVKGSIDQCPHFQKPTNEQKTSYPSECPMSGATGNSDVNPLNMMPPANQMPAPDQPFPLSTTRITSNIPKVSDKNENWVNNFKNIFFKTTITFRFIHLPKCFGMQCYVKVGVGKMIHYHQVTWKILYECTILTMN